jgi:hypothetical protein
MCKNKGCGLAAFAQWACKGPCGEQKGKALSGADLVCGVANSPSPLDHNAKRMAFLKSHPFCFYAYG